MSTQNPVFVDLPVAEFVKVAEDVASCGLYFDGDEDVSDNFGWTYRIHGDPGPGEEYTEGEATLVSPTRRVRIYDRSVIVSFPDGNVDIYAIANRNAGFVMVAK